MNIWENPLDVEARRRLEEAADARIAEQLKEQRERHTHVMSEAYWKSIFASEEDDV